MLLSAITRAVIKFKRTLTPKVTKKGNLLTFVKGKCRIVYNTTSPIEWTIQNFSCGERGHGAGKKLFLDSLRYINKHYTPRTRPLRIALLASPSALTRNDDDLLIEYYKKLGFQLDNSQGFGFMWALYDNLLRAGKR